METVTGKLRQQLHLPHVVSWSAISHSSYD
jgi:hypothetical protein